MLVSLDGFLTERQRVKYCPSFNVQGFTDSEKIDVGLVKVTVSGSAGGHNGVASLLEHLGDGFVRYRLGIGPKQPAQMELSDFVLGEFSPEHQIILNQKLETHLAGLELLLSRGAEPAMNQLNRRDQK